MKMFEKKGQKSICQKSSKIKIPKIETPKYLYGRAARRIEAPNFGLHATNCIANISSTAALISSDNVANGAMV